MIGGIADEYRPYFTRRYKGTKIEQGIVLRKRGVTRTSERVIERNKEFAKIASTCKDLVQDRSTPQKGMAYQICVALKSIDKDNHPEEYQKWLRELERFNKMYKKNLSF